MQERLGGVTKLTYGLGLAAEGIKNGAFNVFLLFFYQQIAGLDPALCGLALFISLCADAVLDPVIGAWSDGFRSPLGRRHPFMYAAILPLAVCYLLVFMPPAGLGQLAKFFWLLAFSVGTRVFMAVFVIPHQSLVPELSRDPGERTTLMSLRTVFAWLFGLLSGLMGYTVFLKETPEYPQGLLNPAGYAPFATFGAVVMVVSMLISALGTQAAAKRAHTGVQPVHTQLRELPRAMLRALEGSAYRAVVLAGLFLFVGFGMSENLNNYMNTFFWGFTSDQVGAFIVVIFLASLAVLFTARPLMTRFGSRRVGMACAVCIGTFSPALISLRLLGLMPDVGDPKLFKVLSIGAFFIYAAIIMGMTVVGRMIADATDAHERTTGARQEGLLFSANMFITKAASGLGTMGSGLVIKLSSLPEHASPGAVDFNAVRNLGLGSAIGAVFFGIATYYFFSRYDLSPAQHQEIVAELNKRPLASAE